MVIHTYGEVYISKAQKKRLVLNEWRKRWEQNLLHHRFADRSSILLLTRVCLYTYIHSVSAFAFSVSSKNWNKKTLWTSPKHARVNVQRLQHGIQRWHRAKAPLQVRVAPLQSQTQGSVLLLNFHNRFLCLFVCFNPEGLKAFESMQWNKVFSVRVVILLAEFFGEMCRGLFCLFIYLFIYLLLFREFLFWVGCVVIWNVFSVRVGLAKAASNQLW